MRRYTRTFVLLLVASLVIAVAPAVSGGSHGLKATFTVYKTTVVFPDTADLKDCGPDWGGWVFRGEEVEGTLTVGKDTYDATFTFEHCSKWLAFDPERTTGRQVGKTANGVMTITTSDPVGSLELAYGGTWVMYDYLFVDGVPVEYTSDLMYRYAFVEESGSGVFEDVSRGHGHIAMTAGPYEEPGLGEDPEPSGTGWMAGSLK